MVQTRSMYQSQIQAEADARSYAQSQADIYARANGLPIPASIYQITLNDIENMIQQEEESTNGYVELNPIRIHIRNNLTVSQEKYYATMNSDAVDALSDYMKTCEHLGFYDLSRCALSSSDMRKFTDAIRMNPNITDISFRENNIGPDGFIYFTEMLLHNTTLESIMISENPLDDSIVPSLIEVIRRHPALHEIYLYNTNLSEASKNAIREATDASGKFDFVRL
jgi:hypothetical protein